MTTLAKRTPYSAAPLVSACALPHHKPGSRVAFSQWDSDANVMRRYTGRVADHLAPIRQITVVDDTGYRHTFECGHIARK